jgi:twinkle protein
MFKLVQKRMQPALVRVIKPKYTLFKPIHLINRRAATHAAIETAPSTAAATAPGMNKTASESAELKSKIIKFLYENKQRPIPSSEKNVIITNCPHCLKVRKNSFAAHVNLQKGTYQCKTCRSKGSFPEFSRTLLKKTKPVNENSDFALLPTSSILSGTTKDHGLVRSEAEIDSYTQTLIHDTHLLDQLYKEHGLKQETLAAFGVGMTLIDNQPCLTFPQTTLNYTDDAFKMETVSLKVCQLDHPNQLVQMDPPSANKDAATVGLFGYQTTTAQDETVILTRRELDAVAAYQATGIPSMAIPSVNYQLQESVLPMLERFSRIYLWLDDDVDGRIAAERFARKLGEHRCLLVNTRQGDLQGPLSARDALVENKDLKQIVAMARGIKHDQIVDFMDLREEVYNEILHPEQTRGVQSKDLPALNEIIKGHRSGELTILTGPTGAGKTTIVSQLSLDYCKSGVPTLWGSFEIMNKRLAKKMLYQFAEEDLSLHPEKFDQVANQFEQVKYHYSSMRFIIHSVRSCHSTF